MNHEFYCDDFHILFWAKMLTSTYADYLPLRHYFSNINFFFFKRWGSTVNRPSITVNRTPDYTSHCLLSYLPSCSCPVVELTIEFTVDRPPATVVRHLSVSYQAFSIVLSVYAHRNPILRYLSFSCLSFSPSLLAKWSEKPQERLLLRFQQPLLRNSLLEAPYSCTTEFARRLRWSTTAL